MENKTANGILARKTVIFAGFSRLPENVSSKYVYGCFGLEVEVDIDKGIIVDASCTLLPSLGEKLLLGLLVSNSMDNLGEVVKEIEERYQSACQRAIVATLEQINKRYISFKKGKKI